MSDKMLGLLELHECTNPLCEICEIANESRRDKAKIALLDLGDIMAMCEMVRITRFGGKMFIEAYHNFKTFEAHSTTYEGAILALRKMIMPCSDCKGEGSTCGTPDFPDSKPEDEGQTWSYCLTCDGRGWK